MRRAARWSLIVLGTLLVLICAALAYTFPVFQLPEPSGPSHVGIREFELIDSSRRGVLEDPADRSRRILVRAWYPAAAVEGFERRRYLTAQEVDDQAIAVFRDFGLPHLVYWHFKLVTTHSHVNAPIDAGLRHPVIIFNHGYWCWPGQNTVLMERLASHGYIVFSIGHPYDAGAMRFADGLVIPTSPKKAAAGVPTPGMLAFWTAPDHEARFAALKTFQRDFDQHRVMQSFNAWRVDIRFLVDQLESGAVPQPIQELLSAADLTRLGFAGMSFGGTSSASACHHDVRCKAAVNLDGEEFDWSLYDAQARMPLAVLHADWVRYPPFGPQSGQPEFNILCDYAYENWSIAGKAPHVYRARLAGSRHLGLTDLPLSARGPLRTRAYGDGTPHALIDATNDFVQSFFDTQLKGADGFPSAVFMRHRELVPHRATSVRDWWTRRPQI